MIQQEGVTKITQHRINVPCELQDKGHIKTGRDLALRMGQAGDLKNPWGPTGYTVTFRCLLPSDPAVAKFQIQPAPNVIIEQRSR